MANYKGHCLFNSLIGLPILLIPMYFYLSISTQQLIIFTSAYLYGTFFASPDLDIAHKTKLLSLRGLLSIPFRLYSRFFRHRGISHILVLGTLSRAVWIFSILFALCYLFDGFLIEKQNIFIYLQNHKIEIGIAFAALCFADAFHILVDKLTEKARQ